MIRSLFLILFLFITLFAQKAFAVENSFVSVVNPVRGSDFWELKSQNPETAVLGQVEILKKANLSATWLLRFDALDNKVILEVMRNRAGDEKGLFLEVTPTWADQAGVKYHQSDIWHAAGSAFLTGYEREQREKLIDTAFKKFNNVFGGYPASVGAWWVDSYSIEYMQKKYGTTSVLIVADQYSTDNYQIWGQYFGTPYYPAKNNALHPAGNLENKLDVVMVQWASRDPVNGYGSGVEESTYSVQANDYIDYHNLDTKYFSSLLNIFTKQKYNQFGHIVVGLENSYSWEKYAEEYKKQIEELVLRKNLNQLKIIPMKEFANWYKKNFPDLSPEQLIVADDPLGSFKKAVWFMNPYYRAGWFFNSDGSVFREIRQYIDGEEELCFKTRCNNVNFATSATRVLDDVSFKHKWIIDEGKIFDFQIKRQAENYVINYRNEAKNLREIIFLPRDISLDGRISSIDEAILNVTKVGTTTVQSVTTNDQSLNWSLLGVTLKIIKFLLFLFLVIIFPGFVFTRNLSKNNLSFFLRLFMSGAAGLVIAVLVYYIFGLLKIKQLIFVYIAVSLFLFIRSYSLSKVLNIIKLKRNFVINPLNLILACIITVGTIFQVLPTFRSGLNFSYGVGFWGPNSHDGIWHMALVNQLVKVIPPENPAFAGDVLKNYHFFYDLLVAVTNYLSGLPVQDLIFRFYPVLFSLMLGIGSYFLITKLFRERVKEIQVKVAAIFGLYLIYFSGSFGWIVEFLREGHFGGESAFWANQAVSFNLNPPFAVSLIIIIALFHIIFSFSSTSRLWSISLAIILAGSLIGFKSYGAILLMASIFFVGLIIRKLYYFVILAGAVMISLLIFLPNFDITSNLLIFSPFWLIHSMIDSPDRVGWARLSLTREAGFETNNWFKIIGAEGLSLVIFVFGNLGLRVISLLSVAKLKSIIKDEKLLLLFIFAILSFLIPILLIQSGNPWNTIQFSYYGLYVAALVSGVFLSVLIRFPKVFSIFFALLIFVLAPINSFVTANGYLGKNPHAFVATKELEGLQFLSVQPDGVVLTYPYDNKIKSTIEEPWPVFAYDSTAYVSAFSKKTVYLEDEPQNQILLTDYKKRLVASKDFFLKPLTESIKFLQENHIRYIYLPKIFNMRLDESTNIISNIFENKEVVIYKLNI